MRKFSIEVQPLSALVGAVVVCIGFITLGAAAIADLQRVAVVNALKIQGAYDPREAVVVRDGTPYTVPVDKILVLTGLGRSSASPDSAFILIDGVKEVRLVGGGSDFYESGIRPLPSGLTASAGSLVSVDSNDFTIKDGRAWGYLVDA
jgi:hypothetical protein